MLKCCMVSFSFVHLSVIDSYMALSIGKFSESKLEHFVNIYQKL